MAKMFAIELSNSFQEGKGELKIIKVSYMEMVWWHTYIGVQRLPHNVTTYIYIYETTQKTVWFVTNYAASQADTWVQERWFKLPPSYNLEDKCTTGIQVHNNINVNLPVTYVTD